MDETQTRELVRDEVLRTLARARQLAADAPVPTGPSLLDYLISEADIRIAQSKAAALYSKPLSDFRDFLENLKSFLEPQS